MVVPRFPTRDIGQSDLIVNMTHRMPQFVEMMSAATLFVYILVLHYFMYVCNILFILISENSATKGPGRATNNQESRRATITHLRPTSQVLKYFDEVFK